MLKLISNTTNRSQRRHSSVFIVNFEHISHPFFIIFIAELEQVNAY